MSTGWPIARSRARRAAFRCGSSAMPPGRGRRRHLTAAQLLEQGPERVHRQGRGRGHRDPIDASIEPTATSLSPVEGQDGVAVVEDKLRAKLESAVQSSTERRVALPVERVKPGGNDRRAGGAVSDLSDRQPLHVQSPVEEPRAREDVHGRDRGRGLRHLAGVYNIQNKAVDPAWSVPDADWAGSSPARCPAGCRRTCSRSAGWASSTARASTAPMTSPRSAPPPRTAA